MQYRIGIGYDIHKLVRGRKLFIGGLLIDYPRGLLGHSDGDVLLHAICDCLLGAVSEGDIGMHFPDTEPKFEGIASTELLIKVYELIKDKGYAINNIDTVIIAEEPKLASYKKEIRKNIALILGIKEDLISIKAKTNEKLGEIGKKEAIAAYATVLLVKGE
ncbi:MAG: 2-C-methyl-D-erythritol 2,4-cyclodiphosphate synthase [Candidatus Omnitrophica bacterium]|nr:2-C-methyl-D-erythritol 2,4-cyclodiphosphate synthase [Candidatus Omnitrophota bacterium]